MARRKGTAALKRALASMFNYLYEMLQDELSFAYQTALEQGVADFYEHKAFLVNGKYRNTPKKYSRNYFLYASVKVQNNSSRANGKMRISFSGTINHKNMLQSGVMRGWDYRVGAEYVVETAINKGIHGDIAKVSRCLAPTPYERSIQAFKQIDTNTALHQSLLQQCVDRAIKKSNLIRYCKNYMQS